MRGFLLGLVIVSLMPLVQAQATPAEASVLTDPTGDASLQTPGNPVPIPAAADVDLAGVRVAEDSSEFRFIVDLHPVEGLPVAPNAIDLQFQSQGTRFWVQYLASEQLGGDGAIYREDTDQEGWEFLESLLVDVSTDGRTWTAYVPRFQLVSNSGAPPALGNLLSEFVATASTLTTRSGDIEVRVSDRAPDDGTTGEYEVQLGLGPAGGARIFSPNPSRVSNGEEATFPYPITFQNLGQTARDFVVEVVAAPPNWAVDLPVTALRLDAGESRSSFVLVSTPFSHQHGAVETVTIALQSLDGNARDEASLFVSYHQIAQPAGHHNALWLHVQRPEQPAPSEVLVAPSYEQPYMNTAIEDPQDAGTPIYGSTGGLDEGYEWDFVLKPGLRMGLDFDVSGIGQLAAALASPIPVTAGILSGELIVGGSQSLVLATLANVTGITLEAGVPLTVETSLQPSPEADFVRYNGSMSMTLKLRLETGRTATLTSPDRAWIEPLGTLQLPLLEYRDPINHDELALDGNAVTVQGPNQKRVPPGAAAVFALDVEGSSPRNFRFEVIGSNNEWVTILAPGEPKPDGDAFVVVQVPPGARAPSVADLIVKATYNGQASLARVIVVVDAAATDDDSQWAQRLRAATQEKESPAPPFAVIALGLLAIAVRRRFK